MSPVAAQGPSGAPTVRALTWLAHGGIFVFGIVMALVGALVPTLTRTLPLALSDVGALFLAMNAAMLAASLVAGLAMDRGGLRIPVAIGAALVALGLVLITRALSYGVLLAAVACIGFGGGALNAGTNTLVADLHDDPARKAAALNLLGVFFGFGALVLPFSIGVLTGSLGVSTPLVAAAALCAAVAVAGAAIPFPAPKQRHGWPLQDLPQFLKLPVVRAFAVLLFFQSGNEFLLGGYVTSFLTGEMGLSVAAGSYVLAGYWGAIMLSRTLLSRVLLNVSPVAVILGGALVGSLGALGLALASGPAAATAAFLATGFALAGIFPCALGIVGTRFPEHSGAVFGLLFAAALTGGMTVPWAAGELAEAAGIRAAFVLAAANSAAVALFAVAAGRAR